MSLLAPVWLLAALSAGIVLLLHTLRQTQHVVPSLYLWKKLTLTQKPRRSFRPPNLNPLLILQVLAVLGIALALAYPILSGGGAPATHHVLVLDRSASMNTVVGDTGRFDAAVAAAGAQIDGLQRAERDIVSVITTGAGTRYLAARQQPGDSLIDALDAVTPTGGTPDWSAVAARLPGLAGPAGLAGAGETVAVTVYTDDPAAADALAATLDPEQLTIVSGPPGVNQDTGQNLGIIAQARALEGENAWEITGSITGDLTEDAPALSLRYRPLSSGTVLDWPSPALERQETASETAPETAPDAELAPWTFEEAVEFPGPGVVELVLDDDAAAYDNVYRMVLDDPLDLVEVLYIGPGNRNLELALLSTGLVDLFAAESVPEDIGGYDLVIAENVVLDERPGTNMLWLGSARLTGTEAPTLASAEVTRWDGEHPLSRAVDWSALGTEESYAFNAEPGAHTVVAAGDVPLLSARTLAEGRDVRLALAVRDTGWSVGPVLPSVLVNIVDWLDTGVEAAVELCEAGAACTVPARMAGAAIAAPDGTVIRDAIASEDGAALLDGTNSFVPAQAGIYTIGEGTDAALIAVNPATSEIGQPYVASPDSGADGDTGGPGFPLWVWIALAVALILLVEAVLALRRREGFARTAQLAADTAAVKRKRWGLGLRAAAIAVIALAPLMIPFPALAPSRHTVVVGPAGDAAVTEAVASACGGLLPASAGQVILATAPYVARDTDCTVTTGANGEAETAPASATGLALELASALVPYGRDGRVLLAGSSGESASAIDAALSPIATRGLAVDVVAGESAAPEGAWVSQLSVPRTLRTGDVVPVTAVVGVYAAAPIEIAFGVDDREISRSTFDLQAGANRIDARIPELEEGEAVLWAEVSGGPEADDAGNGRVEVLRTVLPQPRIAVITPEQEWGQFLADALVLQGMAPTVLAPNRAPFWIHDWLADYDGVILMNVPAIDLDTRQQEQLDEFVRVHGRGLMILGGENTFGPGGYFQTPLEAVSPLSSRVPQEAPVAALAFVLDRSGSMQAAVDGVSRLDIAKQATISAVELLNPESQVTVVVFDEVASVLVPMQERKDDAEIAAALDQLDPGGGTSIAPGLEEALAQMQSADAPIKHIIVMSDGLTQPADFDALMQRATEMNVTVSTVAIGTGADVGRLADLARTGGGSTHATSDFRALPGILSQEAMMLGGESFETGEFPVAWLDRDEQFLEGLPDLPPLDGYVLTSEKPEATLHLVTEDEEGELVPVMASWQYGNGSVLALATHAVGPGSLQWQGLPQFPQLYGQTMRHFLADAPDPGLSVAVRRSGDELVIEAEALDRSGQPLNGLFPTAVISDAEGNPVAEIALRADAAGVYVGRSEPLAPGRYTIAVAAGPDPETEEPLVAETPYLMGYSAALDPFRAAPERLVALAGQTGGDVVETVPDLGGGAPQPVLDPAWRPWLLLGLVLFLLDLTLRYAPGLFAFRRRKPAIPEPAADRDDMTELPRAA